MKQKRHQIAVMLAMTLLLALLSGLSYKPVKAAKKVSTPKITVSALSDGTGIKVTIKNLLFFSRL